VRSRKGGEGLQPMKLGARHGRGARSEGPNPLMVVCKWGTKAVMRCRRRSGGRRALTQRSDTGDGRRGSVTGGRVEAKRKRQKNKKKEKELGRGGELDGGDGASRGA